MGGQGLPPACFATLTTNCLTPARPTLGGQHPQYAHVFAATAIGKYRDVNMVPWFEIPEDMREVRPEVIPVVFTGHGINRVWPQGYFLGCANNRLFNDLFEYSWIADIRPDGHKKR